MSSRRMLVAITVPNGIDTTEVADRIAELCGFATNTIDPTVWEWSDFWSDVEEGVVSPDCDKTQVIEMVGSAAIEHEDPDE